MKISDYTKEMDKKIVISFWKEGKNIEEIEKITHLKIKTNNLATLSQDILTGNFDIEY